MIKGRQLKVKLDKKKKSLIQVQCLLYKILTCLYNITKIELKIIVYMYH